MIAGLVFAALTQITTFGSNPGALDMYEYVPAGLPAGRPLVVVLHGCTQDAAAMETAGWNALADQLGFAVLYPQQRSSNQQLDCFLWYTTTDTARDGGEAASIAQMVDAEISAHAIDPRRIYVTGLSAGAAFTAVLLAAYPDRFAAGSIMSGLPYRCATDLASASACQQMTSSAQKTAAQWGDLVRAADPGYSGARPRVQIWQGSSDYTVYPANATELVKQWTNVWGIDPQATTSETISTATRTRYNSGSTVAVELYLVTGMGHAIATGMDPLGACPAGTGAYFSDEKLCSTIRAAQFFELVADDGNPGDGGTGSSGGSSGSGTGDSPHDVEGGCTTSGGPGGWLVAIALFVLAVRRPSTRMPGAMGVALIMQDRRESKRLALQVPVEINGERPGLSRDISATGMLFHSTDRYAVGEQITVAFRVGNKSDRATAIVVRSDELVTAVRFERPSLAVATN